MAWNDNNGRKQDPWGDSRGSQGPPDLDDAFRNLKGQLGKLFGGGGSGGGGDDSGSGDGKRFRLSPMLIGAIVLVLLVVYGAMGFYQVDAQEKGVVFRFGEALREESDLRLPGLRWNPPIIDRVELVNVTRVNSSQHDSEMLTEDENIIAVSLVVQYIVNDPIKHLVEIREPIISLEHSTESALRHVVGSSTMDWAMTDGREILGFEVEERLQSYLDRYQTGIEVNKVNIDVVGPPEEVQEAFDDVQKSKEDKVRFENEATAYAEQVVPEARGEAEKEIASARAYRDQIVARAQGEADRFVKLLEEYDAAPDVTRDRLYIEATESVFGNASKVLIDVDEGSNLLYLPLDRLQNMGALGTAARLEEAVDQVRSSDAAQRDMARRNTARTPQGSR